MNPFQHIIDEARTWVLPNWEFVEIGKIQWVYETYGGTWRGPDDDRPRAEIRCGWDNSAELVWHEVFHSVFHRCPMKSYDPLWMEGWCNAFAEIHHGNYHPVAAEQITHDFTYHTRTYLIPCERLLKLADYNKAKLQTLWFTWNATRASESGEFTQFMGYAPMLRNQWSVCERGL